MSEHEFVQQPRDSVLFITLDSCRYDTFLQAELPNLKSVGPIHKAQAPSHFTYGSHASMFVGFTPGIASTKCSFLNPKYGKIFKIVGAGFEGNGNEAYALSGRDIVDGFKNRGFATIGSGAMGWFDPNTLPGVALTNNFHSFFYAGPFFLKTQLDWLKTQASAFRSTGSNEQFVFLNVGETHVPYYFEGADWSAEDNPCKPFQSNDRSAECRYRQRLCAEYVDCQLKNLLKSFENSTIVICGDHGDCWGENGIWEHGVAHPMTLTVPLVAKIRGVPVRSPEIKRFKFWR